MWNTSGGKKGIGGSIGIDSGDILLARSRLEVFPSAPLSASLEIITATQACYPSLEPVDVEVERDFLRRMKLTKRIILNVGGIRHEILWRTLNRLPRTRLGMLRACTNYQEARALCDDIETPGKDGLEFFFDRHPTSFASVLNFYRTKKLHLMEDICVLSFSDDLAYWGIDELFMEPCCQHRYHRRFLSVYL